MKTTNTFIAQQCAQAGEIVEFCAVPPGKPSLTWLTSVAAELGVTNLTEAEARQAGYAPLPVQPPGTTPQPAEGEPWNLLKT